MTKNIIVILTALLAIAAVTFIYAGSYLLAPSLHMVGSPPVDLEARSVVFDGVSGWLLKGSNVPGSCVLLMHSLHSDRRSMISRARFFKSRGYSVLLIDFQAHGESPGELITFGYRESRNAHAALNFLKNEVTCQHTYAIGQSMGGAAALLGEFPLPVQSTE